MLNVAVTCVSLTDAGIAAELEEKKAIVTDYMTECLNEKYADALGYDSSDDLFEVYDLSKGGYVHHISIKNDITGKGSMSSKNTTSDEIREFFGVD